VFNVGLGELLALAVLGLLVFGPDKLPGAVSRGVELLRQVRTAAADARQQMSSAAGLEDGQATEIVRDLQSLHPRRIVASALDPAPTAKPTPAAPPAASGALDPDLP
jgi:sec-independent protein translocase protein TatB